MSIKNFGLNPNRSGRPKGAKNRLSWSFLTALAEDFEEFGAETIRICRIERPNEYLKSRGRFDAPRAGIYRQHIAIGD